MKDINLDIAKKPLGFVNEFKEFAMRGNVVDLAVGVVIGAAFGKIVTSLVTDIITPVVGAITPGSSDLKNKFLSLDPAKTQAALQALPAGQTSLTLADAQKAGPVIAYGQFLTAVVDFIIVALCIFLVVKLINKLKRTAPPPPAEPTAQEKLLIEIRDLLKKGS